MAVNKNNPYTWIGLGVAFFLAPLILTLFSVAFPGPLTNGVVIARETSVFLAAGLLLLIIFRGEKKGLDSIGLHQRHWGKSVLRALLLMVLCIAAALACVFLLQQVGISYGDGAEAQRYNHISLAVMSLMVARAGIVEELFYRGYIMERLEAISGRWLVYFLMPAVVFGLLHFRQGIGGILISFVLGLILAWYYWKYRDLKANIIAHFLVDFIPNVIAPLFE